MNQWCAHRNTVVNGHIRYPYVPNGYICYYSVVNGNLCMLSVRCSRKALVLNGGTCKFAKVPCDTQYNTPPGMTFRADLRQNQGGHITERVTLRKNLSRSSHRRIAARRSIRRVAVRTICSERIFRMGQLGVPPAARWVAPACAPREEYNKMPILLSFVPLHSPFPRHYCCLTLTFARGVLECCLAFYTVHMSRCLPFSFIESRRHR